MTLTCGATSVLGDLLQRVDGDDNGPYGSIIARASYTTSNRTKSLLKVYGSVAPAGYAGHTTSRPYRCQSTAESTGRAPTRHLSYLPCRHASKRNHVRRSASSIQFSMRLAVATSLRSSHNV